MKATITCTTPCLNHSYQNVPHDAESTAKTTKATATLKTKTTKSTTKATATTLKCIDAVECDDQQDDDDDGDGDGCDTLIEKSHQEQQKPQQQWQHKYNHNQNVKREILTNRGDINITANMPANLRSNRYQREHKMYYRKHVMMMSQLPESCKRDEIHMMRRMMIPHTNAINETTQYARVDRLNLDRTETETTSVPQVVETTTTLTSRLTNKTKKNLMRIHEDFEKSVEDTTKFTSKPLVAATSTEERVTPSSTSSLASVSTISSTSKTSSASLLPSETFTITKSTATAAPLPCLDDLSSLSNNNKRQLVMPIEEANSLEENTIINIEKELAHKKKKDSDRMERRTLLTPHTLIQTKNPNNIEVDKVLIIQTKQQQTEQCRQHRHKLMSRRPTFMSLRVGMKDVIEYLATAINVRRNDLMMSEENEKDSNVNVNAATYIVDTATIVTSTPTHMNATTVGVAGKAASSEENSQTTTKLDCRCFKEKSDICMSTEEEEKEECVVKTHSVLGCGGDEDDDDGCGTSLLDCGAALERRRRRRRKQKQQQQQKYVGYHQLQRFAHFLSALPLLLRKGTSSLGVKDSGVPPWPINLMFLTLFMLAIASPANCWTGRSDVPTNCTFPARWEGSWFLSGYQQSIHIKGSQFSYRGKCAASDGNKYLIVDEKGCHRCLVIYEKHKNVLQYKESECEGDSMYMHQTNPSAMAMRSVLKQSEHRGGAHPNLNLNNNNNNNNGHSRLSSSDQYIMRSYDDMNDYFCKGRETLQNLCDQIPGDALLYSLFRESAEPVKCPLKGPFIFTYNRGHGECKNPVSNIESCTEDSRLLLSFQACPDVQGTESTVEELTCLATWKDGNSRYLVGLVSHHHAISNEERYRCFVYEKISSLMGGPSIVSSKDAEYKLAQSGDATCNGLDSAEVGSRIMSLRKPPVTERCDFPVWFKGPRHWHVLMGNAVYHYHPNDGSVHIIKPNGFMETRALCEQINKQTSTEMMAVVHYTTGCQSGFMCMMFYRRDTHVIEIQTGKQASRLEDACAPDHFDINRMPFITLLASNPDPQICPMEGLYNLRGAIGPPYLTTRHKRNHNNKMHSTHGHHHAPSSELGGTASAGSGSENSGYGRKRHATLNFRETEATEKEGHGLTERNRRAAANNKNTTNNNNVIDSTPTLEHMKILENTSQKENGSTRSGDTELAMGGGKLVPLKSVDFVTHSTIALENLDLMRQRNRRDAPGCITNYKAQRRLWVGCTEPDVIDVRPLCTDDGDEEYSCHGSWTENGTVYIIARHKGSKHGVCLSYRPTEGTAAKLVIGDACYRGIEKPPDHHLVANLTVFGKCGETGSAAMYIRPNAKLIQLAMANYVVLLWLLLPFFTTINIVHNQR